MAHVSFALREDSNSIFLLQDAGRRYDKCCQITVFCRNLVRPEFFRQYLYFAPYAGNNGKYHGEATDLQISIEDNGYAPSNDFVASIDSEVEFRITPSVLRQLSRDFMPAWGVKPYLDFFSGRNSGIILFLRVYRVNKMISSTYLEKGIRGSAQIFKLYDINGEEASLPVDVIEPVISDNKFSYLKEEILHLLKVENVLLAQYDGTAKGLTSLQERIIADKQIQGTHQRWENRNLNWLDSDSNEDDDFDMAQLDYDAIFREVEDLCPGMKTVIDYAKGLQAARIGEYDYYLRDVHSHTENERASIERLFEMSVRSAVRVALNLHKKNGFDLEDVFQEACVGILTAIQKHNDKVMGLFPSYASMWMRQIIGRDLYPYSQNVYVPVHYRDTIEKAISQINKKVDGIHDLKVLDYNELVCLLERHTEFGENAVQLAYMVSPADSLEMLVENSQEDSLSERTYFSDDGVLEEEIVLRLDTETLHDSVDSVLSQLPSKERLIIRKRYGFDGEPQTLEEIGKSLEISRERVRQLEVKALKRIKHPSKVKYLRAFYKEYYSIASQKKDAEDSEKKEKKQNRPAKRKKKKV